MINITSSVKAEGDKPSLPQREGILYLLKDITLEKHKHTEMSESTEQRKLAQSSTQIYVNLFSSFTNPKLRDRFSEAVQ